MDMLTLEHQQHLRDLADRLDELARTHAVEQGFGALRMIDRETDTVHMCCLGVACAMIDDTWVDEITDADGWEVSADDEVSAQAERGEFGTATAYFWGDTMETAGLAGQALDYFGIASAGNFWADGIDDDMPEAMKWAIQSPTMSLAEMNDGFASFADIADTIRYILDHPDVARFYAAGDAIAHGIKPQAPAAIA